MPADDHRDAIDPQTRSSRLGQLARASPELARLVARNPAATSGVLRRLALLDDLTLLVAVCEHPSTPEAVAHALAARCPEAFARGAHGRRFLADPSGRPPTANHVRARLRWSGAPAAWFERGALHGTPSVRAAVAALAPTLALAAVPLLARDAYVCVRRAVAQRADLPPSWVATFAADPSPRVREVVVLRRDLSIPIMLALARDASDLVRHAAAAQPAMPADELMALARDASPSLRWRLVENPALPPYVLEYLAEPAPASQFLAGAVARHPNANERVAALLLSHVDAGVRHFLVLSARVLSRETWDQLVADPSEKVRHALAYRADVPVDVLVRLARDDASLVRAGAARNERTPSEIVERFVDDPSVHVRSLAAENRAASPALHRALARDPSATVRGSVAKWTNDAGLLVGLASDVDASVRLWVFFNRTTPADVKQRLAGDREVQWRRSHG